MKQFIKAMIVGFPVFAVIPVLAYAYNGNLSPNTAANSGVNTTTPPTEAVVNSDNTVDWESERAYWRDHYASRPYFSTKRDYSTYEPAYRYGLDTYNQNPGVPYDSLDMAQIRAGWDQARGNSNLSWEDAQLATRDAYTHLYTVNRERNTGTLPSKREK